MITVEISYQYLDATGQPVFYIDRLPGKRFRARLAASSSADYKVPKELRVLYHLPEVLSAIEGGLTVHLCEGEKDADALRELGAVATTNPFGAKNWQPSYSETLCGSHLIIYVDKDEAGSARAKFLRTELMGKCRSLEFRQAKCGKDPFDHIQEGYGLEDFLKFQPEPSGIQTLTEFIEQELPEVEWMIGDMLGVGCLGILVAKPKVGKSTLCEELIYCAATGEDFLGRSMRKVKTLFLALEAAPPHLVESFKAIGIPRTDDVLICTRAQECSSVEVLRTLILQHHIEFVIIDTLARFVSVQDLNDYAEVTKKLTPLAELCRETNTTILLTHHSRKGAGDDAGDSALGSTAIFGMVDSLFRIQMDSSRARYFETQLRYGRDITPTLLNFDQDTRRVTLGESRAESRSEQIQTRILGILKDGPQSAPSVKRLSKSANWNKAVNDLIAAGHVSRIGEGVAGKPYIYTITSTGLSLYHSSIKGCDSVKDTQVSSCALDLGLG